MRVTDGAVMPSGLGWGDYPEGDGKPMAETAIHRDVMILLILMLKAFFARRRDVYVSGNMMLYYEPGNRRAAVAPDVFVTMGVPKLPERRVYFTWREGKPPTVVVEVTSRKTRRKDLVDKRDTYARMGVQEYFLFDPLAEYLRPQLQGFRLVAGAYEPVPVSEVDGSLVSEQLGLLLVVMNGQLRLIDRTTGDVLPTPDERAQTAELRELEARAVAAEERQRAAEERQRADAAELRAESLARQLAEERARVAELDRRLRERLGQG